MEKGPNFGPALNKRAIENIHLVYRKHSTSPVWNMSASRRRHSEQLPVAAADEETSGGAATVRQDQRLRQQPLVRTRSSAHLFLGQLTGTCSSLFRRLSVKVRYLSLSLIPGSGGGGGSRPSTPAAGRRDRPRSADRVDDSDQRAGRTRPRRHTTTVLTMDESTPVARHGSSPITNLVADQFQRGRSPSPGSDSEATPTPSPCTVRMPVAVAEDTAYSSGQQHLRADDYPTLKGSSRRRRRHHQNSNSSSGSSNGSGQHNNNNNVRHHHHHHHHRKSLAEASTGRDQSSPAMEGDANDDGGCDHQFESTSATPLALDQCFALGLNLTTLAPPTDSYLAGDQESDAAGSSEPSDPLEPPDFELTNNNSSNGGGSISQNPYFDWFLTCNLEDETAQDSSSSSSLLADRRPSSTKVSKRSVESDPAAFLYDQQPPLEDLPYPILLDDWISPPSPPSPVQEPSGDMDSDPLAALRHHSTWFEEYAYPAYASKSANQASSKSSNRLSASGTGGSSRMMAEKAYPYVSSPATPRHSNKYQTAPYDPYDLLSYDDSPYLSVPEVKGSKVSSSSSNSIPVPSGDKSSSNNNSERGVHPGPESLPGVDPGTRHGPSSATSAKMPPSIVAAGQPSSGAAGASVVSSTRTVRSDWATRKFTHRLLQLLLLVFFCVWFLLPVVCARRVPHVLISRGNKMARGLGIRPRFDRAENNTSSDDKR